MDENSIKRASEFKEETELTMKEDDRVPNIGAPVTVVVSDGGIARPTDLKCVPFFRCLSHLCFFLKLGF